ncbi:hypothetical protein NA57DRAFT_70926 [Rhizodiscina lignyota]|uniref:Uncharacterized protein n=1 Tax=Rhizodiscina lignyota TaxID=1504668 RepID=A0A9P4IRX9_9PEZI|nr:hypothetical protein NA57DRAFT_70926 [Rhizodiscina lignyota]
MHHAVPPSLKTRKLIFIRPDVVIADLTDDGADKGDILIYLPKELGHEVQDIVRNFTCPNHRRSAQSCLESGATNLLSLIGQKQNQLGDLLLPYPSHLGLPLPARLAAIKAVNDLTAWTRNNAALASLAVLQKQEIAKMAYWLVYIITVAAEGWETDTIDVFPIRKQSRCHIPRAVPFCMNCGGKIKGLEKNWCQGYPVSRQWAWCPCQQDPKWVNIGSTVTEAQKLHDLDVLFSGQLPATPQKPQPQSTNGPFADRAANYTITIEQTSNPETKNNFGVANSRTTWYLYNSNHKLLDTGHQPLGPFDNKISALYMDGAPCRVQILISDPTHKTTTDIHFTYLTGEKVQPTWDSGNPPNIKGTSHSGRGPEWDKLYSCNTHAGDWKPSTPVSTYFRTFNCTFYGYTP